MIRNFEFQKYQTKTIESDLFHAKAEDPDYFRKGWTNV